MDTRFEIIVVVNGVREYLDTYQNEPISLNFNIADLTDIPSRNSSYSKTIKIPETKKNRRLFGDIANLASSTEFDPNKKTRAWILVDGLMVLEGYIQLRYVFTDSYTDRTYYEVVIFADNDNFFKALGEKFLTDLDWSELNHLWTGENIRKSWTASNSELGYYYPLIDYGFDFDYAVASRLPAVGAGGGIGEDKFFPATNVKYMVDKIFQDTGYQYQSNFLNSPIFKKLYIPYSGKELTNPVGEGELKFSAGRLDAASFSTQYFAGNTIPQNPNGNNYVKAYPSVNPAGSTNYFYSVQPYDWGVYRLPFNVDTGIFADPDGVYNTTLYEFRTPVSGPIRAMQFVCNFDLTFQFGIDPSLITTNTSPQFGPANTPACWIGFRRSRNAFGVAANNQFIPIQNGPRDRVPFNSPAIENLELLDPIEIDVFETGVPEPSTIRQVRYRRVRGTLKSQVLSGVGAFVNNYRLFNNEAVWVEIKLGIDSGEYREQINLQQGVGVGWNGAGNGYFIGNSIITTNAVQGTAQRPNVPPGNILGTFSTLTFNNIIDEVLIPGDFIDYNQVIPKNIKNKDFISALVRMFNLYIEPSKEIENLLIIEPRDDYYAAGVIKDWTGKLDLTDPIREQILAETQNREFRFKYRDDNDFYNEEFTKKENITFGEYRKILDNDFTIGVKTIEPLFSPTPLVPMDGASRIIIPKIGKLVNSRFEGYEMNLRIGTRYEPNQTTGWVFGGLTSSLSPLYPDFAVITSQGIPPARQHAFNVGDVIQINQNDGGTQYPTLQGAFEVMEVINSRTITIRLSPRPTWTGYVAGVATPLPGVVGGEGWYFTAGATGPSGGTFSRLNYYPYLGHFSHPLRPNYDLNYAQSFGYFYPLETLTQNTLYRNYWQSFIEEITDKDSRIITVKMNLSAKDISEFSFSNNIYLNGQYYRVNKISDFDPANPGPCRVELIKTKNITIERTELQFGGVFGRDVEMFGSRQSFIGGSQPTTAGVFSTNRDNQVGRADSIVAGRENQVQGQSTMVAGNRNQVFSDRSVVFGDSNVVNAMSDGNLVFGSNNTIGSGIRGSIVFGNNQEITSSNTLSFSGVIVSSANGVEAGKNEVLSPFSIKPPNYIESGKNAVLGFGSQDPINYIQGEYNVNLD